MPKTPIPLPQVRTVGLMQPMTWLVLAWRDMARSGWISFAHGLAITAFGGAILAVAHHRFWLLAGALSGFLVVAPVLATSLYALSRALEQRQEANLGVVLKTWLNWQNSHFNKWGNDYWCMVQFGACGAGGHGLGDYLCRLHHLAGAGAGRDPHGLHAPCGAGQQRLVV